MSLTDTGANILHQQLTRLYVGKTILSGGNVPFKVESVRVWDDSPDPGWTITLSGGSRSCPHSRSCHPEEPLPEIWPFEPPMSPCS